MQRFLDLLFVLTVQGRSCFVQYQNLRVFAESTSYGDSLFLTTRQLSTVSAYVGIYAVLHLLDEFPSVGLFEHIHYLIFGYFRAGDPEVVCNGHGKEDRLLSDKPDFPPKVVNVKGSNVPLADGQGALGAVIVTQQQLHDGALTAARLAHQSIDPLVQKL